ncbi:G patch domain-containing protein 11 isoform X2 [Aplysia californica]|nr:G patch domain-containing protein 11 isoform X2 [Aplysia californica]
MMHREKGLQTSLSSDNKGFALLQKMGYKPGMGIGKQEKGRVDPVSIEVKADRGGLGRDTERKRKVAEMDRWRAKRQKTEETRTSSFLHRMSDRYSERNAERDLRTAQKACLQLDQQEGLAEPNEDFFWPQSCLATRSGDEDQEEEETMNDPCSRVTASHDDEEEDEELESVTEFSDPEKLEILTKYLRNTYKFCIWCGTRYDNAQDLDASCPGNSASSHE